MSKPVFKSNSLMNTTVEAICYRSKKLSDGKSPLMLRLTKSRKRKYISLHFSIDPIYWDFKKNKPKRNCPDKEVITAIVEKAVLIYRKQVNEFLVKGDEFTLNSIVIKASNPNLKMTFGKYFDEYISKLLLEDRVGYAKSCKELKSSIEQFYKTLDFSFSDIDINWLKDYEFWLRKRNNSENTLGIRFRTLRAIYNKAIIDSVAKVESYPFNNYKVSKLHEKTAKRAITREIIKEIVSFDISTIPEEKHENLQLSRDIFIFSYLGCGINLTDIASLSYGNIIDNRVTYNRQKTGKLLNFSLQPLASEIIERYRNPSAKLNDYLFPILNSSKYITATQKRDRIKKFNNLINSSLKLIGNKLNIPIKLTTYVARHSFATVLKRSGVSTAIISESLGHSSEKVTQIYLDNFENNQINDAMKNLI